MDLGQLCGLSKSHWPPLQDGDNYSRLVMGSKEGTYWMVHCVLYATNEASNFTSESGDVLYGD